MTIGRGFLPHEERIGDPSRVVVISHDLWREQFGSDRDVIGRAVRLNGRPFTVVGVTPDGFTGYSLASEALWVPLTAYPDDEAGLRFTRQSTWLMGVGRLTSGATVAQARASLEAIVRDLQREYPDANPSSRGVAVVASGAVPQIVRPAVTGFIAVLFALVALILAVACINVGGMLLVRGVGRAREVALRLALGAARPRIVRLLVTESVLLAAVGAAVGIAGGWAVIRLLYRLVPILPIDVAVNFQLDWRVVSFSVAVALAAGLLCGLMPALKASRVDLASAMKPHGAAGRSRPLRTRQAFVVAQISLSLLLVVCALLLVRSLRSANTIDPGFVPDRVEVAGIDLRLGGYDAVTGPVFAEEVVSRLERLPGVESAASTRIVPLTMSGYSQGWLWLPEDRGDNDRAIRADWNLVTPAYWPGQDPIGRSLVHPSAQARVLEVVGVARDAKYQTLGEEPQSFVYVPLAQHYHPEMWLLVRTGGPSAIPAVRELLREMNPNLPLVRASTLTEATAFGLVPSRLAAWLAGIVGLIGVLLAALGVYGVTAYNVCQRTREIGIRVALGALRLQVIRMVVRQAMVLAAAGILIGIGLAAAGARLLTAFLYGVEPLYMASFGGGALMLAAFALVACIVPASRALRINATEALRHE